MALHFSKEEFSKRKQDVLKSMKEQNLDALLMFRQESMYWLTGYVTFGYVFFSNFSFRSKRKYSFINSCAWLKTGSKYIKYSRYKNLGR